MKRKLTMLFCLLLFLQASFAQTKEVLTNKSVSDLVKAGLDKEIVISKIQST